MPCRGPEPEDIAHGLQKEVDRLTQMLCTLCQKKEDKEELWQLTPPIRAWWVHHKEADKRRLEAEQRAAKAKLDRERAEYERLKLKFGDKK